ncbi:MAG: hypothetical protein OER21_15365 [Gemmatimonadota bacterium]|nr:hypothetical protein [Gemmatimonadota bacterium]
MAPLIYRFAESLRQLLVCDDPAAIDACWEQERLETVGWQALGAASGGTDPALVPVLDEVDGLLLRLLDRVPLIARRAERDATRLVTFRQPELERLQHAAAAALVAHRFGPAGLAAVAADPEAPLARRYHAFLTLARLHAATTWPLFRRYLVPEAHHAFVGVAAEAARYYPARAPAPELVTLFDEIRSDVPLRTFLSPRILGSLFVLADRGTLPFYRELLVTGHTDSDPERCEVTHALVMVRRFTGAVAPSSKFTDRRAGGVAGYLDEAEAVLAHARDALHPVAVL